MPGRIVAAMPGVVAYEREPAMIRYWLPLKVGVGLARSRFPEAVTYVEHHFVRKLHTQNVLMAQRIIELAKRQGTPRAALEQLLARLEVTPPAFPT